MRMRGAELASHLDICVVDGVFDVLPEVLALRCGANQALLFGLLCFPAACSIMWPVAARETELGGLPGARPSAPVIRLDQAALALAGGPPSSAPLWDNAARQVLVQFLDGTWRLCRLIEWRRRDVGTWLCDPVLTVR
jgi:hypothetical protein